MSDKDTPLTVEQQLQRAREALTKIGALTYPHTGNVNRETKRCDQPDVCPLCVARQAARELVSNDDHE